MLSQPSKTLGLLGAPQSISGQSSVQPHHPAFPFHPFHQWLNPAWKPILATAHQNRFLSPQSLPQIPLPSDLSQFHQRNISSVQQQQKQNIYMPPSNKLILPPSEFSPSSDFATLRKHNERKQEYENDTKSFKGSNDNEPQKNEFDGSTGPLDLTVKTEKYDRVDNKPIMANISSRHSSNEPDKAIKKDKHRIKSKKHHSRAINTIKIEDNERNSSFEQHKHHQYSPGKQQHQSGSRSSSTEQLPEEQEDDHQQHTPITDISVSDHSRESFYDHPSRSQLKTTSSNRSSKAAASTTDISALSQQRHFNQHHQNDRSQSPQPIDSQQSSSRLSSANSNSQTDPTSPSQSLSHIPSIANPYGQKIFICSVCEQHFLSVETINDHFTQNHLPELEREISGKSPPRNTNVAQQNEEWNLSDPTNPLKCIQCDFVGRWPTELQKHAASHSSSRPFKCLICSLTYKWRWDLAKHFDRAHPKLVNPYKKRDRDQARSLMEQTKKGDDRNRRSTGTSSSPSSTTSSKKSISSRKLIPAPIVKQRRSTSSQLNDNEQLFEDLVDKTEISITDSDNEVEQEDRKTKSDDLDLEKENDDDDEDSLASPPTKRIKNKSNSDNHVTRSVSPPVMIDQPLPPSSLHPSFPYMPMTSASHPIYFPPPFYTGFPHSIFPSIPFMNPSLLLQSRELQKLHNMPNFPTSSLTSSSLSTSNENPPVSPSSASPSNLSKNRSSISNAAPFQLFSQNQRQQSPLSSSSPTPSSNATTPRSENNSNSNVTAQQHADNQFILNQAKHHRFAIAAMQAAAAAAAHQQQQQQPQTNGSNGQVSAISGNLTQFRQRKVEKEDRNFQCRWCDYRGRWRSELIQHMRCHHAQLKPYHCSACPYA
ncbi:unnamed protein product [Didymodactylos carnosus]|uniref:C2H2-type domain-containing protein n=4 Tax=Didymodactylos carnosus TaxID=1234261 RepID=A0A8S2SU97_9BILA|nr:unnamed protein product [Didymodactylos carnosus]